MSVRNRLVFALAVLLAFGLIAIWLAVVAPGSGRPSWLSPRLSAVATTQPQPAVTSDAPAAPPATITEPTKMVLVDLHNLDELKARFNADQGRPRVVLVLSPT